MEQRFDRNARFFGAEGQLKLRASRVAVVGVGGLGTQVVQQLALLGVGELILIDHEELETTNLNRYVSAQHDDPVPGTSKVDIALRMVARIDPELKVTPVPYPLMSREAFDALKGATAVFGCLDDDAPRFVVNEFCSAYDLPLVDLASDIFPGPPLVYGGRVAVIWNRPGCLHCLDVLDMTEVARGLESVSQREQRLKIYGVDRQDLDQKGPSVVSLNGVVASLGVTEFMVAVTGIRSPNRLTNYYGNTGKVVVSADLPLKDCYYCNVVHRAGDGIELYRYVA